MAYREGMTLAEYLARPGITATALAKSCGVATSTIPRVAKGEQDPSGALLRDIFEHTGGAVTANDIHGIAA